MKTSENQLKWSTSDFSAGIVVFLVALPLCLGIALASGAPLFSGVLAGICGGIVAGFASQSRLGVSGPAAGLTVIVLSAIQEIGTFEAFLLAVVLAGIFQIFLGFIGAGKIAFYFPSSVIKGMLSAIGIIIVLKQIPHAFGIDTDPEGDESFQQVDGENTLSELTRMLDYLTPGAIIISLICLAVLILWERPVIKRNQALAMIPGPLMAVILGVGLNLIFPANLQLSGNHLVNLPVANSFGEFLGFLSFPDFQAINRPVIWETALIIAVIASLETLLCVEATDRLDPDRSITPTNRELFAQGVGNIAAGLIGGIPVTQVIVRSSANIQAGGKTKLSTIFHGFLLLGCAMLIPGLLNKIPLSALAAVLIMVGYKLSKPSLYKAMYREGIDQFVPFIVTIVAILFTDLLVGIGIGLAVGLIFVIFTNFRSSISSNYEDNTMFIRFNQDVFFYNRANLMEILSKVVPGNRVFIDGTKASFIDHDIFLLLEEYVAEAPRRDIQVTTKGISRKKLKLKKEDEVVSKTLTSE